MEFRSVIKTSPGSVLLRRRDELHDDIPTDRPTDRPTDNSKAIGPFSVEKGA